MSNVTDQELIVFLGEGNELAELINTNNTHLSVLLVSKVEQIRLILVHRKVAKRKRCMRMRMPDCVEKIEEELGMEGLDKRIKTITRFRNIISHDLTSIVNSLNDAAYFEEAIAQMDTIGDELWMRLRIQEKWELSGDPSPLTAKGSNFT